MGLSKAEHSASIPAPAEDCFDAIVDYETFPRWQSAVQEIEVLERDRKGRGERVRFQVDGKVRTVRYTLRYHYDPPKRIWWDFLDGQGIKHLDGEYLFEDQGDETLATYRIEMDPGMGVPGPVARRVGKQLTKRSVEDLADEVIRRQQGRAKTEERPAAEAGSAPETTRARLSEGFTRSPGSVASGAASRASGAASRATGLARDAAGTSREAASGAVGLAGSATRGAIRLPGRILRRGRRLLP